MPPGNQPPYNSIDTDHMLPPAQKKSSGAIVGIAIIVLLAIFGALYFWGALLNQENQNPPPYIPPDASAVNTN